MKTVPIIQAVVTEGGTIYRAATECVDYYLTLTKRVTWSSGRWRDTREEAEADLLTLA